MRGNADKANHTLWWLGLISLCLLYWLKIIASPTFQTTFDSTQYLQLAQKTLDSTNWWQSGLINTAGRVFVPYSPAYPIAIAVVALLTGLPVLWASKVLGFICLGLLFTIAKTKGNTWTVAWWVLLASDANLHIFTHTWAEGLMITGLVYATWLANEWFGAAVFAGMVGICSRTAAFSAALGILSFDVLNVGEKRKLAAISLIGLGCLVGYLGFEGLHSHLLTGGVRGVAVQEWQWSQLWVVLAQALAVFKTVPDGGPGSLLINFGQGVALVLVLARLRTAEATSNPSALAPLVWAGLFYMVLTLTLTHYFSMAEGLDLRLFYPGVLLVFAGCLGQFRFQNLGNYPAIAIIFALALLHLPWRWLLA